MNFFMFVCLWPMIAITIAFIVSWRCPNLNARARTLVVFGILHFAWFIYAVTAIKGCVISSRFLWGLAAIDYMGFVALVYLLTGAEAVRRLRRQEPNRDQALQTDLKS